MPRSGRKRSKHTLKREPLQWNSKEIAALLVWADRCVELKLDFRDTVVQQLKEKWPERDFTYDIVKSKMYRLWNSLGKDGTQWLDMIAMGTQCLDLSLLADDMKKELDDARSEFSQRRRQLRSRTISKPSSPWTAPLRSSARSLSTTVTPMMEPVDIRVHLKVESERTLSQSPGGAKRVLSLQPTDTTSAKKSRRNTRRSARLQTEIPDSDDAEARRNNEVVVTAFLGEGENLIESVSDGNLDSKEQTPTEQTQDYKEFLTVFEEKDLQISLGNGLISTLQQSVAERDRSILTLKDENETLHKSNIRLANLVSRLSREDKDRQTYLKDQQDCWKAAQRYSEANAIEALKDREVTITNLKRQIHECEQIALPEPTTHIKPGDIAETIGHIEDRVKCWSYGSNITFPGTLIGFGFRSSTEDFLRRSGLSLAEATPIGAQIIDLARDIEAQNVLRVLTAAALREWIFESDFYNFDEQESELLAMYRRKLLGQNDGPRLLRSFDFVAQRSLLTEKYFQELVLEKKAEELTVKFLELLVPLFPPATPDNLADGITTTVETEGIVDKYKEIFGKALKLKADLMLTTGKYEMKIFEPGTAFSPAFMRAETKQGADIKEFSKKSSRRVKLCLFPALYLYPAATLPRDIQVDVEKYNFSTLVVQSRNFLLSGDAHGNEGRICLSKAVVLLENEKELK